MEVWGSKTLATRATFLLARHAQFNRYSIFWDFQSELSRGRSFPDRWARGTETLGTRLTSKQHAHGHAHYFATGQTPYRKVLAGYRHGPSRWRDDFSTEKNTISSFYCPLTAWVLLIIIIGALLHSYLKSFTSIYDFSWQLC